MAFTYTNATAVQAANYSMISNGTAFDTSPAQFATMLHQSTLDLKVALTILTGSSAGTVTVAPQLEAMITVIETLLSHLNNHYTNVITNLKLVTSAISDAIGYGVIGQPGAPSGSMTNPTASLPNYFGSIMGKSNGHVAQLANIIANISIQASALLAGAMISTLSTSTHVRIQAILGSLSDPDTLNSVLQNLTPANLQLLSTTMNELGTLLATAPVHTDLTTVVEIAYVAGAFGITDSSAQTSDSSP